MAAAEELWEVRDRGFLPKRVNPEERPFEESLGPHYQVLDALPRLHAEGLLEARLRALPLINFVFEYESLYDSSCVVVEHAEDAEACFTLFGILVSAFVHLDSLEFLPEEEKLERKALQEESGQPELPRILPPCLGVPIKVLSAWLGRKPILDYAGSVLTNWAVVDPAKPMALENVRIWRTFTQQPAEEWFYKIHVLIEHHAGAAIKSINQILMLYSKGVVCSALEETDFRQVKQVIGCTQQIKRAICEMNVVLGRMRDGCKDSEFYNVVRPWLGGWSKSGVVYASRESQDFDPEVYSGGSGAQSSIMPCLDLFFGVVHGALTKIRSAHPADSEAGAQEQDAQLQKARRHFNMALKRYQESMPRPHRALIEHFEQSATLRDYIHDLERCQSELKDKSEDSSLPPIYWEMHRRHYFDLGKLVDRLKESYNDCIEQILNFRRKHIGFAISYITSQAKMRARRMGNERSSRALLAKSAVGTGGSNFKDHLMQHINDTRTCLYPVGFVGDQSASSETSAAATGEVRKGFAFAGSLSVNTNNRYKSPQSLTTQYKESAQYVLPGLGPWVSSGSIFGKRPQDFTRYSSSNSSSNTPSSRSPSTAK